MFMDMVRLWWADSRGKTTMVLLVLWMVTLWHVYSANLFWRPLVAVVSLILLDVFLGKLRWGAWFFSLSSVVTGLLIGLIFDPSSSWLALFIACFVASVGKHFIGTGRQKHIFNPAALGIVVASIMFGRPVAWWAGAWGNLPLLIVVTGMTPILHRLRRLWMPATFLVFYFLANLLFVPLVGALRLTLDSTAIFFALIMVPEPLTSTSLGMWRYGWGVVVGVLVLGVSVILLSVSDPLLVSLLAANAIGFFFIRNRPIKLLSDIA